MNHAITIGGLLLGILALGGLGAIAVGALMFMAGGMSDAPAAGEAAGKQGCIALTGGAVLFALAVWGLLG
jgi:hypothetical protein